ncbi:hypothetical protein [Methanospirillum lacunae]|uniref:Uncharacterized protein n=1 Tax=Methanospirillum lacunae TaxID=668570 RepID=A0A2V2NBQ9_9EURY|nr:hypothetical protein [Methanospirillum lacunae]PWR73011.1 hypothetical protein DK846_05905 [Methanospirillum lacunae]
MKLERNSIIAIVFGVTLAILLLFNVVTSGFKVEFKGILVSVYFAIWVAAVAFVLFTFVIPYINTRKEEKKKGKAGTSGATPPPYKSPRSGLPVRERITAYVTERRKEDGLPAPEPLRPARPAASEVPVSPAAAKAAAAGMVAASAAAAVSSVQPESADTGDLGDLPLPDDFGSEGSGDEAGELPGLDDDFGDMDEFGGGEEMLSDFGDDTSGLLTDDGGAVSSDIPESPVESGSTGELPGFDGDLDSEIGESDIMGDDSMMDLSGDDLLVMDEEQASAPAEDLSVESDGGLSEAGLPDLDDTLSLEPDMMESDLSGGDEDFGDIEFVDLEPEEPKKPAKK